VAGDEAPWIRLGGAAGSARPSNYPISRPVRRTTQPRPGSTEACIIGGVPRRCHGRLPQAAADDDRDSRRCAQHIDNREPAQHRRESREPALTVLILRVVERSRTVRVRALEPQFESPPSRLCSTCSYRPARALRNGRLGA
jgi:hypothetical protein